jgi:hypothetical protein
MDRAALKEWMRDDCPHALAYAFPMRLPKNECPDCLLAFAAAQRAEERHIIAKDAEQWGVLSSLRHTIHSFAAFAEALRSENYERARCEGRGEMP